MTAPTFYDRCWLNLGVQLHATEKRRIEFIVCAIAHRIRQEQAELLDLGCGRGWMAPFLSRFGRVTGVDFSPQGIAFAREHYAAHATFVLGDATSGALGIEPGRLFDFVISSEVIEHAEDQRAHLRTIAALLRPNGYLVLTTPNGNVWQEFSSHRRFVNALQPVERWLTPSALSQFVREAGFAIELHEGCPMPGCPFGRHRLLQRDVCYRILQRLGLGHQCGRFLLMDALYQHMVARRDA